MYTDCRNNSLEERHEIRIFRRRSQRIRNYPARQRPSPGAIIWARPNTARLSRITQAVTGSTNRARKAGSFAFALIPCRWISLADIFTCATRTRAISGPRPGSRSASRSINMNPNAAMEPPIQSSRSKYFRHKHRKRRFTYRSGRSSNTGVSS